LKVAENLLPRDATLENLTGPAAKREEYLRRMTMNFDGLGASRDHVKVRIGVAGRGISPHYKFEAPVEFLVDGQKVGSTSQEAFLVFHGKSHKGITAFEVSDIRDEHWSSKVMTYQEVRDLFRRTRAERRR
jgi:hypothetical protein